MHSKIYEIVKSFYINKKIRKKFSQSQNNFVAKILSAICNVAYILERKVMSKQYRKPSVPRTKRTLVGYDKLNDVPLVIDTNIPDLSGTREPQQNIPDGDKYLWTCRFCQATTKVGRKVCSLCNRDADTVIKIADKVDEYTEHKENCDCCTCDVLEITDDEITLTYDCNCICIYEPQNIESVRDGQWKPSNRYDTYVIEVNEPKCIECFIILPIEFVTNGLRKCESCRK